MRYTKHGCVLALAIAVIAFVSVAVPARAVTVDGDLSDIRALIGSPDPGMPPAQEQADPSGFTDEPILASQAGGQSPSGFNIGSMVAAYDPVNDAYYIGLDVSPSPSIDDLVYSNGSGAWDGDGDGNPDVLTDGLGMTPAIVYDVVPALSVFSDKYNTSVDIGNDGGGLVFDFLVKIEITGSSTPIPVVTLQGPGGLSATADWTSGDYLGNGPDVEIKIEGLSTAFPGIAPCDFYTARIVSFADTDADSAEETVDLVFEFDRPVTICKVDAAGAPVVGWTFSVTGAGDADGDYVTGDDGCVTFFAPVGSTTVTICETLPQDALNAIMGDVLVNGSPVTPDHPSDDTYCVTVNAADCPEVTFQNKCEADITVRKLNLEDCADDPATGTPVSGFTFHITGPGVDQDLVTDGSGEATITVDAAGTYTICETLPQAGKNAICSVWVDGLETSAVNISPGTYCADVAVGCDELGESHEVVFYDTCTADITVRKVNLEDCSDDPATGTPVSGFTFHITGPGVDQDLVTDGSGEATISVGAGTYTICETLPQAGKNAFCSVWVDNVEASATNPDPDTYCADVAVGCDELGESHEVVFYDTCTADITVRKLNLEDCADDPATATPVEGFTFHITGPGVDQDLVTDASGEATLTVPCGTYTICETLPQGEKTIFCSATVDGAPTTPSEPTPGTYCVEVTADGSVRPETHEVEFYNTGVTCEIQACKKDENGAPLEGWTFLLLDDTGTEVDSCVTGADGCCTFTDLEKALYYIAEQMPQTVGAKTYNTVGDVTVEDKCAATPPSPVTPEDAGGGLYRVPVDLTGDCCSEMPDLVVTWQNSCEVELVVCKLITDPSCDPAAPTTPKSGWTFTLTYPDTSQVLLTTLVEGCTEPVMLEPGTYEISEELPANYEFCRLLVDGGEVTPTRLEDTDTDGTPDIVGYEFTITCQDIAGLTFTFVNGTGGPTRTPGYWFTHPDAMKAATECITGDPNGTIDLGCCSVDPDDAMAIFWRTSGGNRPTLAQHILAAMYNQCYFGTPAPGTIIADGLAVLCNPDATSGEIGAVIAPLDMFNNSGDDMTPEGFWFPGDPATARAMAAAGSVPTCAAGKRTR